MSGIRFSGTKTRRSVLTGGAASVVAAFSGMRAARSQELKDVSIAIPGYDVAFSHTFCAMKTGLFKKHGLNVSIINAQGGGRMTQMVAAGQANYGIGAVADVVRINIAGRESKIIAGFDRRLPYANLLIRADNKAKLQSIADLAGMTIGVTQPQTTFWMTAAHFVEKAGVQGKVTIRPVGDFITLMAAVKSGQIAATIATISMLDTAIGEGWGVGLFDARNDQAWQKMFGGTMPASLLWTLSRTIGADTATTSALVAAFAESHRLVGSLSPQEIADLIHADYLRSVPRPLVLQNIADYQKTFWSPTNLIERADYDRMRALMGGGRLFSDKDIQDHGSYESTVDMSFVESAAKR